MEGEHRVLSTALILMQTLTQHAAFINCNCSLAEKKKKKKNKKKKKRKAQSGHVTRWNIDATSLGRLPESMSWLCPQRAFLILGTLCSFPRLHLLPHKMRVLILTRPISQSALGEIDEVTHVNHLIC